MQASGKSRGRRNFLRSLANIGAAGMAAGLLPETALGKAHLLVPPDPGKGHVFLTAPYLQQPSPSSMTIMWVSNMPAYGWVEYGETSALGSKAHSITNGLVDAFNRINRIPLSGLKPGTQYYYRTFSREITGFEPYKLTYGETIQSDIHSFTTPHERPDTVSCLILNDIHDRPRSIPHLMQLNGTDPYDFVFFNGDIFDFQTDEQQIIDHMLEPCTSSFAREKPFLYVRGNHETRGKYRRDLPHYFHNPGNRQYFSYTWGPVHFIVLDTGEDKPDDHPVYAGIVDFDAYRQEQLHWLEQEVQTEAFKTAPFRVVLMHIPVFYSGDWHGTMHCRQLFAPVFDKHKVDLCISGHTHRYGVHPPVTGQHSYPIIIGGGPLEGKRTLIKVKADQKQLRLRMLDDAGAEVGKYDLTARH